MAYQFQKMNSAHERSEPHSRISSTCDDCGGVTRRNMQIVNGERIQWQDHHGFHRSSQGELWILVGSEKTPTPTTTQLKIKLVPVPGYGRPKIHMERQYPLKGAPSCTPTNTAMLPQGSLVRVCTPTPPSIGGAVLTPPRGRRLRAFREEDGQQAASPPRKRNKAQQALNFLFFGPEGDANQGEISFQKYYDLEESPPASSAARRSPSPDPWQPEEGACTARS